MSNYAPGMEAMDFSYLLLEYYKKLGINETELSLLLMLDHLLKRGNDLVTPDIISMKMNLKSKELDSMLVSLIKRGFVEYAKSSSGLSTSLEPLKKKLYAEFGSDLSRDRQNLYSAERSKSLSTLYAYYEKRLARTLSPIEMEQISIWLDDGFPEQSVKDSLEEAIATGRKSIKTVDKILRMAKRRDDIEKEGVSAISDTWSKSIDETLAIVKKKWIDGE